MKITMLCQRKYLSNKAGVEKIDNNININKIKKKIMFVFCSTAQLKIKQKRDRDKTHETIQKPFTYYS